MKIARVDGKLIVCPSFQELEQSDLDLVISGNEKSAVMIESESKELSEEDILKAMEFARSFMEPLVKLQKDLAKKCGKPKRKEISLLTIPEDLIKKVKPEATKKIKEIILLNTKEEREDEFENLVKAMTEKYVKEDSDYKEADIRRPSGK